MKASEWIKRLQLEIDNNGDLDVAIFSGEDMMYLNTDGFCKTLLTNQLQEQFSADKELGEKFIIIE